MMNYKAYFNNRIIATADYKSIKAFMIAIELFKKKK